MSFDARSKERLEALGRTLPKKLPLPDPSQGASLPQQPGATGKPGEEPRHRLEQEQDPAELFRVLMKASPDGSVPPHLLERLRELEMSRMASPARELASPSARPSKGARMNATKPHAVKPPSRSSRGEGRGKDEQDLYSSFAQLLLEDDDA